MAKLDLSFLNLAEQSHGLLTYSCLTSRGVARHQIRRAVEAGALHRMRPGLLRVAGSPRTLEQMATAAVLGAGNGAAVSLHTAAALWRLPGFRGTPVHVSHSRVTSSREFDLGILHQFRRFESHHVIEFDSIPVTTPARTLFDLAAHIHPGRLARLADRMLTQRLCRPSHLHRIVGELGRRGMAGTTVMRQVIAERPLDYIAPESNLEARFLEVWRQAGLPSLERQVNLGGGLDWIGRVDFYRRPERLVIEIQSDLYHASLTDRAADDIRFDALREAGFEVWGVPEFDIWHRRATLVQRARSFLAPNPSKW